MATSRPKSKKPGEDEPALPSGWSAVDIEIGAPVSGWELSGDGSTVMVRPKRTSFRLFNRAGKELPAPGVRGTPVLDRDGKRLAMMGRLGPLLFLPAGKRGWKTVELGGGSAVELQFTPQGQLGGRNLKGLRIWSLKNPFDGAPPIVDELGAQGSAQCNAVAFHPAGADASLAFTSKVRTFELSSGLELGARDLASPLDELQWTADGAWLMGLQRGARISRAYFWKRDASEPQVLSVEPDAFAASLGSFEGKPVLAVGLERGAVQLRDPGGRILVELPTPFERPFPKLSEDGRTLVVTVPMAHRVRLFVRRG